MEKEEDDDAGERRRHWGFLESDMSRSIEDLEEEDTRGEDPIRYLFLCGYFLIFGFLCGCLRNEIFRYENL